MKEAFLLKHLRCAYNQHDPCAHFHKEEVLFVLCVFSSIKQRVCFCFHVLQVRVLRWINPPTTSLVFGTLADLTRSKAELLAENELLRHQLFILRRLIKRPTYLKTDRLLLVLLARMVRTWKQALFLIQPETDLVRAA
jgi:putative transposase